MGIVVVGDIHAKNKEPYRSSINNFFAWLIENYKDQIIVLLGDLFDSSTPHADIEEEIVKSLVQFKKVYILTGNHDTSRKAGNTLKPLIHHHNIIIIEDREEIEIENTKCLFLPHKHTDIKQEYEEVNYKQGEIDIVFSHITHPKESFGNEGMDIKNINASKFIYGHTHTQNIHGKHIILGVPLPSRHLEHNQVGRIMKIDSVDNYKFIDVPEFFTFEDVPFGETPKNKNNILNVLNAPSIQSVYAKYPGYYIREEGITIHRDKIEFAELMDSNNENKSLSQEFIEYARDKEIDKDIQDCCLQYLGGI